MKEIDRVFKNINFNGTINSVKIVLPVKIDMVTALILLYF